ncbi:MAG: hypothetical protein CVV45_04595 [Spirochaetae bacterium HGW-Spirochaetae-10]|nr:MAG: hypothetical protein CVV45_04595 [Spirochaetae bacterium HGW-Spirochaetae-10]
MSQENKSPLTSLLPIVILGVGAVLMMQLFDLDKKPEPKPVPSGTQESLSDFTFKSEGVGQVVVYDNGPNVYVLSSKGGRIERIYVKNRDSVRIPDSIIDGSSDPIMKQYRALEITMGNGMDFQPHLYYRDSKADQLAHPPLNDAIFSMEESTPAPGVREYRFSLPFALNDHKLELIKVYRFLEKENFFHQVTVIRNLENKPLIWLDKDGKPADLFFKPFAGVGPGPESDSSREMAYFGRFINYNDSLSRLPGYGAGGSGWFGCSGGDKGPHTVYLEAYDTLKYVGAHSRYFIAYARFLPTDSKLSSLDGAVVANNPSLKSDAFYTSIYKGFTLAAAHDADLQLKPGAARVTDLVKLDQARTDAVVINMQVFAGLRADDQHVFNDPSVASGEFGEEAPESAMRDVIYSSTFLALFAKIRDGIIWLLRFVEAYVGNYGYAIIIIAVGWKLVTYPLNQMQAKTMKKMNALKPEMDVINEKYKDDPNERQKKIMEVYKKHKINPAKGCLPILIQIPIFIALYSAFTESIELWHSPFILWMHDLSEPDTVYTLNFWIIQGFTFNILPLIMVVSQFAQQKLTTVASDPQQKMLMYMMPFIMIFFFWSMPSGVTLYWTVQNIISVLWQLAANRFAKVED